MRIVRSVSAMRALAERWRRAGLRIGFVPTMGALHAGHVALVRAARGACDRLVVSIFVNPMQFGPREDLARYPRRPAHDRRVLAREGVDVLFAPSARGMYPPGFATSVEVTGPLVAHLCAPYRPGHFRGVATVVLKLFNVIRPHVAWFGRKDAQQAAVVARLARDLDTGVSVRVRPTVREAGGLALSSRNAYLSPAGRRAATVLYRALQAGAAVVRAGARRRGAVLGAMRRVLAAEPRVRVQYVDVVNARTLEPAARLRGPLLLAVAAFVDGARLIDNLPVRPSR
jgi:pantoate--beta-alanine ligase